MSEELRDTESVRYDAFISYRHCSPDKEIAEKIHRSLENFRLPHKLAKKLGRNRLSRVFRDEAELAVSAELSESIDKALRASEYLIVICSPRLQESKWCMQEIETFLTISDREHILLVLIEGEPDESFPVILQYEEITTQDYKGNEVIIRRKREPLAGDCRGDNRTERKRGIHNTVLRLCAVMFGIRYDDLKQRQREEQIRRRSLLTALTALIVLVIILQNAFYLFRLKMQNNLIAGRLAVSTATASEELLRNGHREDAVYAARSVLPDEERNGYTPEAVRALVSALGIYNRPGRFTPVQSFSTDFSWYNAFFSPDGSLALNLGSEQSYIMNTVNGEHLYEFHVEPLNILYGNFCGNDGMHYITSDNTLHYLDFSDYTSTTVQTDVECSDLITSGEINLMITGDGISAYHKTELLYSLHFSDLSDAYVPGLNPNPEITFSKDGEYYAIGLQFTEEDNTAMPDDPDSMSPKPDPEKKCLLLNVETASGQIVLKKIISIWDFYQVLPEADSVILVNARMTDNNSNSSEVSRITGRGEFKKEFDGDFFFDIKGCDGYYMLDGGGRLVILDGNFEIVQFIGTETNVCGSFYTDDSMGILYVDGSYYEWNPDLREIQEDKLWESSRKDSSIGFVEYREGKLFVTRGAQETIVYGKSDSDYLIPFSAEESEDYYTAEEIPEEERQMLYDALNLPESSIGFPIKSSDGKYYGVPYFDGRLEIFDTDTLTQQNILYSGADSYYFYLEYIEKPGYYITGDFDSVYILDRNMKCICEIPDFMLYSVDSQTGMPVVYDITGNGYRLQLLSYDDLIRLADKTLDGYKPDPFILERYGLQ